MNMGAPNEALFAKYTDWRINLIDVGQSVLFPGQKRLLDVEPEALELARLMQMAANSALSAGVPDPHNFVIAVGAYRFRLQLVRPGLYAARRFQPALPELDKLGLSAAQHAMLTNEELQRTGGLIIIGGTAGSGKTTTATGIMASRLKRFGGYGLTVEDPPEYPLEGFYGERGYCEQIDASKTGFTQAIMDALRCFPAGQHSMLMFGEVRSREAAYELIQVALDGHLVITTLHAKDIVSGISRLISLAAHANGEKEVRTMLAASLQMFVHQRLENGRLHIQTLKMDPVSSAIIQNGAIHSLQDIIIRQNKTPGTR
ncbi:ATPase, T2SS/T4P/T4SS family [Paraburkholderia sp. UCT31]|uniref:ATPase, T2SS/T4P/T4SS family n=1 Tax=Paraburkholderia sp. UCT31 TaxID=2615209 RepID=UPI0016560CD8|nr:ATPase, T2SS/T4P/T4SS family [Paraburkholderia sp. UCT31]